MRKAMSKIIISLAALTMIIVTLCFSGPATADTIVVTFPDVNLEGIIREAIEKPSGDIYSEDLLPLTFLDGSGKGIIDLTGLEYCVNLTTLRLNNNEINDILPLQNLTNLIIVHLAKNRINDIRPLVDNPGLSTDTTVYLYDNPLNCYSITTLIPALETRGLPLNYTPVDADDDGVLDACEGIDFNGLRDDVEMALKDIPTGIDLT